MKKLLIAVAALVLLCDNTAGAQMLRDVGEFVLERQKLQAADPNTRLALLEQRLAVLRQENEFYRQMAAASYVSPPVTAPAPAAPSSASVSEGKVALALPEVNHMLAEFSARLASDADLLKSKIEEPNVAGQPSKANGTPVTAILVVLVCAAFLAIGFFAGASMKSPPAKKAPAAPPAPEPEPEPAPPVP